MLPVISVVDADPYRVGSASFCRIRIPPIRIGVPNTCIFYFLHENFNMLFKILKIMAHLPLKIKEKHCKLAVMLT